MKKQNFTVTIKLKSLIVTVLILISCAKHSFKQSTIISIKFVHLMQDFHADNSGLISITDSMNIIFDGEYRIYERPTIHTYSRVTLNKNGDAIGEKIMKEDTFYTYTIYNKHSKYGYSFDSIADPKPKRINVDTFLRTTINKGYIINEGTNLKLTETRNSDDSKMVIEKYSFVDRKDGSDPDSEYYYYNRHLMNIPFSLSEQLDSFKHSKLIRARYIFNARPNGDIISDKKYNIPIPRRELSYQFSINNKPISKDVISFIARVKATEKKLYKSK